MLSCEYKQFKGDSVIFSIFVQNLTLTKAVNFLFWSNRNFKLIQILICPLFFYYETCFLMSEYGCSGAC